MTEQLTLDGRAVDLNAPEFRLRPTKAHPLSPQATAVMRHLTEHGEIRSVEAGEIVHSFRRDGQGCWPTGAGKRCCRYASADGLEAMKRLAERGLARRDPDRIGRWLLA